MFSRWCGRYTLYLIKYSHVLLCILLWLCNGFLVDLSDLVTKIPQGGFTGTGLIYSCLSSIEVTLKDMGNRSINTKPPQKRIEIYVHNAQNLIYVNKSVPTSVSQIEKFMGPTWGPSGSCRPQMSPMWAPWTLLSGMFNLVHPLSTLAVSPLSDLVAASLLTTHISITPKLLEWPQRC